MRLETLAVVPLFSPDGAGFAAGAAAEVGTGFGLGLIL